VDGGFWFIQLDVSAASKYREDLPVVRASRLRAQDLITDETAAFLVQLGHVEQSVGIYLRKFPNGGSWSLFVCPTCGRRAQTLRLHLDDIVCPSCCKRRGVRPRADTMSVRQRAQRRILQLKAMLQSETPLRLKPSTLWGTMEKRSRLEARLRECEFRVAHGRASSKTTAVEDPCNAPDFVAPKRPWPRSKPKPV
jgi:DNA-directed RNA polymerase subunit RPC12/RpoP